MTHTLQAIGSTARVRFFGFARLLTTSGTQKERKSGRYVRRRLIPRLRSRSMRFWTLFVIASSWSHLWVPSQDLRSDSRASVWLLWTEKRPLADLPGLVDAVLTQAFKSNATARALIEAWLRAFSQDHPSVSVPAFPYDNS